MGQGLGVKANCCNVDDGVSHALGACCVAAYRCEECRGDRCTVATVVLAQPFRGVRPTQITACG